MGLITPSPTPIGIIADLICSALNQNIGAYTVGPAAVAMERRTVRWLTDLVGYGENAGGNLTSGGMMANFIGLKLAGTPFPAIGCSKRGFGNAGQCTRRKSATFRWIRRWTRWGWEGKLCVRCPPTLRFGCVWMRLRRPSRRIANAASGRCASWACSERPILGPLTRARARKIADREEMWLHADAAYGGGMLLSHAWPMGNQGWSWQIRSPSIPTSGSLRRSMRALSWSRMIVA